MWRRIKSVIVILYRYQKPQATGVAWTHKDVSFVFDIGTK